MSETQTEWRRGGDPNINTPINVTGFWERRGWPDREYRVDNLHPKARIHFRVKGSENEWTRAEGFLCDYSEGLGEAWRFIGPLPSEGGGKGADERVGKKFKGRLEPNWIGLWSCMHDGFDHVWEYLGEIGQLEEVASSHASLKCQNKQLRMQRAALASQLEEARKEAKAAREETDANRMWREQAEERMSKSVAERDALKQRVKELEARQQDGEPDEVRSYSEFAIRRLQERFRDLQHRVAAMESRP